ncbi:MAG: hypothetical protein WCC84_12825 [Candidatus Cybelea sp.]
MNRLVFGMLVGCIFATLAGCNGGAVQSSAPVDADAASSAALTRAEISSDGEKRVGHYVWVWRTAKMDYRYGTNEVDCPANYSVVGGGYHMQDRFLSEGAGINASKPNDDFTGWMVVGTTHMVKTRGTVYAACAQVK